MPLVQLQTTLGDIYIVLYDKEAPNTVDNFLGYVDAGLYDGVLFHRSVPGFVIQAGGYTLNKELELSAIDDRGRIKNEFKRSNLRGTLAMAKLGGDPDSASNQWFINLADNSANLDVQNGGFTVFAKVVDEQGMQVADNIAALSRYNFGGVLSETPTIGFDGSKLSQEHFVFVQRAARIDIDDEMASLQAVYLTANLNIFGTLYESRLKWVQTEPSLLFQLDLSLTEEASATAREQGRYEPQRMVLELPRIRIRDSADELVLENVVLKLIDGEQLLFELHSIDGVLL